MLLILEDPDLTRTHQRNVDDRILNGDNAQAILLSECRKLGEEAYGVGLHENPEAAKLLATELAYTYTVKTGTATGGVPGVVASEAEIAAARRATARLIGAH